MNDMWVFLMMTLSRFLESTLTRNKFGGFIICHMLYDRIGLDHIRQAGASKLHHHGPLLVHIFFLLHAWKMFFFFGRCIPYRYKVTKKASLVDEDALEVLVISAQRKGKGMLFPKVLHFLVAFSFTSTPLLLSLFWSLILGWLGNRWINRGGSSAWDGRRSRSYRRCWG